MKTLILTLISIVCSIFCKAETIFKDDIFPLTKSDVVYSELLKSFSFHPQIFGVTEEDNKRTVSTLVAFNTGGKPTTNWSNYIDFTMIKDEATKEFRITSITFRELGSNAPCFQPSHVLVIGADKSLVQHNMEYPSLELNLKDFQEATKSKANQHNETQ